MATDVDRRDILIVGGGIGGPTLALALEAVGLGDRVRMFEAAPVVKHVGGGLNLGAHAIQVLSELGLESALLSVSKQPSDYAFFTRNGQLVYREPWGKAAGHLWPHISIHRAELQKVLLDAVRSRLGPDAFVVDRKCASVEQTAESVSVSFVDRQGRSGGEAKGAVLIGCDGVHSAVRKALYPNEGPPAYHGINLWRGVTRHKPFLTGSSIARIGATESTLIIYPVRDDVDEAGNQLVNWVAEVDGEFANAADWTGLGRLEDFYPVFQDWTFDWLDAAALIRNTEPILAYPMVDRDPLDRWTFGRITLLGDAAHPMYPRGGNGAAQTILDARSLAREIAQHADPQRALEAYEADRRPPTSKVVLQNRSAPPNVLVDLVEKRTGGRRFERLEDYVREDELREIFSTYQKVAGYHVDLVGKGKS